MTSIFLIVLPLGLLLKNTYLRFFAARQNCHKGSVKDEINGDALIGCTVTVKGGKQGVTTDVNGNYSISLSENNAVLVFAYIGYDSKEINVGNQSIIDINLKANTSMLNEVIVIGYGNTKSKDVTGSVKSIKSESFNKGIINSPEQLLQGKVAGVNITASSGEPGARLNINVRGSGGVRTGSTPLFVIDGFALDNSSIGGATNPLTFLNHEEIESIDVLKDASATAIYGSRGANGVILISTKKGKKRYIQHELFRKHRIFKNGKTFSRFYDR